MNPELEQRLLPRATVPRQAAIPSEPITQEQQDRLTPYQREHISALNRIADALERANRNSNALAYPKRPPYENLEPMTGEPPF